MEPIKGLLGVNVNQTGKLVTPSLQYTSPTFAVKPRKGPAAYHTLSANLGYNDQGLSAGIGDVSIQKINKRVSSLMPLNLNYNGNQGLAFSSAGGLNFNVLDSKMKRAGDTRLNINPYLGFTVTGKSLANGGVENFNNQFTSDGKTRGAFETGVNAGIDTMLTKNLFLRANAGLGIAGKGGNDGADYEATGDYGTNLRFMPSANVGLHWDIDKSGKKINKVVKKLLYQPPTPKPKLNPNATPEFTRSPQANIRQFQYD